MTSTIVSMSATAMCSFGVWISAMPFASTAHGETALGEDVRVGTSAGQREGRREPTSLERGHRQQDDGIRLAEAIRAVAAVGADVQLALGDGGSERATLLDLPDEIRELRLVVAASLGEERAALGDDVARRPALDHSDVGRRLGIDRRPAAGRRSRGRRRRSPSAPLQAPSRRGPSDPGTSPRARRPTAPRG